jgi:hypothetical protein
LKVPESEGGRERGKKRGEKEGGRDKDDYIRLIKPPCDEKREE